MTNKNETVNTDSDGSDVCKCLCHQMPGVLHVMACCDGPCPHCNQNIRRGMYQRHVEKCASRSRSGPIGALLGGYIVTVEHNGETYHIKIKEGVRGMNLPASAELIDGAWHVSFQGSTLTVLEVTKLVPVQIQMGLVAYFSIKPSDVVAVISNSPWRNCEKETVAANICKLSRFKNGDSWAPFTWEDYTTFCSHKVSMGEKDILDSFVEAGYLENDANGAYCFTRKMIGVYMQYT